MLSSYLISLDSVLHTVAGTLTAKIYEPHLLFARVVRFSDDEGSK